MAEHGQRKSKAANRRRYHVWFALALMIAILIVVVGLFYLGSDTPSIGERLAIIEAARAIPDSQNAALAYNELLLDPNATSLLDYRPKFFDDQMWNRALKEPWLDTEYPQLAQWIQKHQFIIDKIHKAAKFEECRFPIVIDVQQMSLQTKRGKAMRQWAFLLTFAANNDVLEGQIDAAITKWRCITQMANHLYQQPTFIDHTCASAIGRLALVPIARLIVEGKPSETHLRSIETLPVPVADDWAEDFRELRAVESLSGQKLTEDFGPFDHLNYRIFRWKVRNVLKGPDIKSIHNSYLRHIANCRVIRVLITLRRFKNKTDHWPQHLEEIASSLAPIALIDPQNNGSYVYRLTEDGFRLYSTGPNGKDENGLYTSNGPDDLSIWPPR